MYMLFLFSLSLKALNYRKYSTSSDVWSFGCLMYEIWSLGHKPFEGKTNTEVSEEDVVNHCLSIITNGRL